MMCKGHALAEESFNEAVNSQQHLLPLGSIMEINRVGIPPASTLLYAKLFRKAVGRLRQCSKIHLYSYIYIKEGPIFFIPEH